MAQSNSGRKARSDGDLGKLVAELAKAVREQTKALNVVSDRLVMSPSGNPFTRYRTLTAARTIAEANMLLKAGWDYIGVDFCEEVMERSPTTRAPKRIGWIPYILLGYAQPMVESDRLAQGTKDEAEAIAHSATTEELTPTEVEPEQAQEPAKQDDAEDLTEAPPRGKVIGREPPHRTAELGQSGGEGKFEGTGGLTGRR